MAIAAPKVESGSQGDVAEAVRFLQTLRPAGTVCLCAIVPDGPTEATTFDTTDEVSLRRWIAQRMGRANLYYTVNPVRGRPTKKPTKDDIARAEFQWIDLDPSPAVEALPGGLARERSRLEELTSMLDMLSPTPPTFVVDTGNGYQALWRRSDPEELDGKAGAATALAEDLGRLLELSFGADNVRNVDRLLRLPGTINLPNATKRAKGRGNSVSRLVTANDTAARADELRALCVWHGGLSLDEPLRTRFADLLHRDNDVLRRWLGGMEGLKDGSRSSLAMSMAGLLTRRGFDRTDIAQVLDAWELIAGTDLSDRQIERMVERTNSPDEDDSDLPQRDRIILCGMAGDLWHDPDHVAHATVEVGGHLESYVVRSSAYRRHLLTVYGKRYPQHIGADTTIPGSPSSPSADRRAE